MGLFDGGGDGGLGDMNRALNKNRLLYSQLELPEYDQFSPELLNTESANYELLQEDPQFKSKQLEALSKLSDLSATGLSAEDEAGFAKAADVGNQVARRGTQAALENANARGIGGSGLEFAMREGANQDASERARQMASERAAQASQQRAQYLQAYAGQLGQVRGQDMQAKGANTDVINKFNMANTQGRNQTQHANTGLRNDAWQYNQGLKDKNYQNQLGQADRIAGMNTKEGEMLSAEEEAKRRRQGAITGAVGAGIGGMVGGPAGATVGYGVGSNV